MAVFDFMKKKESAQKSAPKLKHSAQPQLILWDEEGTKYEYVKNEVILGRNSSACDLAVNGTHVSRIHLRFLYENDKWYVEDMNSTAGSWVNGDKLQPLKKIELSEGDRINLAFFKSFYFMKKTEKDTGSESAEQEQSLQFLENVLSDIAKNDRQFTGPLMERLIYGLSNVPMYIGVQKPVAPDQKLKAQFVLHNLNGNVIVPIYTRRYHAQAAGNQPPLLCMTPMELMAALISLGEHVVINVSSEDRCIIPKELLKGLVVPEVVKKIQITDAKKAYMVKKDMLGYLVCDYQLAVDQMERMKKISALMGHLQENSVWVPCTAVYSEEDAQKFVNAQKGDRISLSNAMRMKPDILKDHAGKLYFPVFSAKEEAPEEYRNRFSWMNLSFVQCCRMVVANAECNEIIINAFTHSLPITEDLIKIILNHAK